jgi:hypothetical protein
MHEQTRTHIAVLGTLAEFHAEPIPYNLQALLSLVSNINPDLLCLDIPPESWQQGDFTVLPPEYRDALIPLAQASDMVVVPIGRKDAYRRQLPSGWRGALSDRLLAWLAELQRRAPGPDAINQGWRHEAANGLYHLLHLLEGSSLLQAQHIEHLTREVIRAAHRDPGCRILVVANVQYCHHIRPRLRKEQDIEVVSYTEL